ncbi:hypothetical protein GCM10022251_20800 [Phytohabitans flavus]|uniref:Polyketide synthase n=2 Tax=Phytohabitans flavus TaxID=1076124 RepID=A0A6F8XZN5_9ACTN|nr:type I polyketide synthase [Phytohabitans flavus]BCB79273.1 hypothetical protein Pflav_056830 [Phytohabitans flavus]
MTSTEEKLRDYLKRVTSDLQLTRQRLKAVENRDGEPIAVIGMACHYPGGVRSPEDLWRLVVEGVDAISDLPNDRGWDVDAIYDPDPDRPGTTYTREGGFLAGVADFDAAFFGISPREALAMDPQQRLLLETAWEAVESAGVDPSTLRGTDTGTFVGAGNSSYVSLVGSDESAEGYTVTGAAASVISGRISYLLGLEGPAVTVDTACSASLVALHLAAQSLRSGECSLAFAGGVAVMATPAEFVEFSRQRGLAPDGRCKPFADAADGVGWGEGVGVLLLERLSDAQRNGHPVLALIRGSAVNQDGASSGLTAPSGPSQQRVIRSALDNARLAADQVDVVEGHGTGTTLGDPIEAQALLETYGQGRERPLWLGSVKSNIGHTQAAAGVAGVIKMIQAIRYGLVPKTLHVDAPSTRVDWSTGAIALAAEAVGWPDVDRPRRAGVSSFGISGTNAHVIVEQPPTPELAEPSPSPALVPWIVSAKSEPALDAQIERLAGFPLAERLDVGHSLAAGRALFPYRAVLLASAEGVSEAARGEARPAPVAMLFSGQGSQRLGMGRDLYDRFPVFASALDEVLSHLDPGVRDAMWGTDAGALDETGWAQPALFAVEVALFRLVASFGVTPDHVAGHSIGEVAAAHAAGVLSLEDACRLVSARASLMQALPAGGAMVALRAAEADVLPVLTDGVSIAAVNGPTSVVIAGEEEAVLSIAAGFGTSTRLRVSHAFHSPLMEPMLAPFRAAIERLTFATPRIPVVGAGDVTDPEYWVRHVRDTVRFSDAVSSLDGATFLEIGPDGVLTALAGTGVPTLRKDRDEETTLLTALAHLHTAGASVDWSPLLSGGRRADLPTYPFQRQRFWPEAEPVGAEPADGEFWSLVDGTPDDVAATLDLDGDTVEAMLPALRSWRSRRSLRSEVDERRYRVTWTRLREPARATLGGAWLVAVPDEDREWADAVTAALAGQGAAVVGLSVDGTTDRASLAGRVTALATEHGPFAGVVSLLGVEEDGPLAVLALVQALGDADLSAPLWCVTRGAVATGRGDRLIRPAHAAVWGLGRTVALEQPARWGGLVDLPDTVDDRAAQRLAAALAGRLGHEDQVAVRPSGTFGRRLVRAAAGNRSVATWRARGTVLVTGGTGGLGMRVARWAAANGAEHLILASRRGSAAPGVEELRQELTEAGTRVTIAACDVGDRGALAALLNGHEVTAVFHVAGYTEDGDGVLALAPDDLAAMMRTKAASAWHLHELTRDADLDAFVLFSSVAATWGGGGQPAYSAANAVLDAIAEHRRAEGLSGTSVAWGTWGEVGMTADRSESDEQLRRRGVLPLRPELAIAALQRALDDGEGVLTVAEMDWHRFLPVFTATRPSPLLSELPEARSLSEGGALTGTHADRLVRLSGAERDRALLDLVRAEAAAVLKHESADAVRPDHAFRELGFDSLAAVELRNRLTAATGLELPTTLVFDYPTPSVLSGLLAARLSGVESAPEAAAAVAPAAVADPIVIVGMSCRYPGGADSAEALWRMLVEGRDGISPFPTDRGWDLNGLLGGRSHTRSGGFLAGAGGFDAGFFKISPREAVAMDPQQRLLLEVSWEAVERAGIDPLSLKGSPTGVFVGASAQGYETAMDDVAGDAEGYVVTGSAPSVTSGRLSYVMGLEGPAVTVDTACSSSLVALHLAAQALRQGECDLALVGGVTVMATPAAFVEFSKQGGVAADGRCKAFSDSADGTGWAEGVGVLVVERLSDAVRRGHEVLAVVRSSAVNQDGASNGLTAPNGPSQQRVIRQALANAGLTASDVDMLEAHGTGTALGDPIEAQAVLATYGQGREHPLLLGSIKSNIGHTQAAAGVAGVIKAVQALRTGVAPTTLHVTAPSSHVDWSAGSVALLTSTVEWPEVARPRRAAVSSFGISGTNAHVILEQATAPEPMAEPAAAPDVVAWPVAAASEAALDGQVAQIAGLPLADRLHVGHSLATGRAALERRAVLLAAGDGATEVARGIARPGPVAMLFSGQGSQRLGMGRELYDRFPVFAAALDDALAHLDPGLCDVMWGSDSSLLNQTGWAQPALFAVEVALYRLVESWGIRADHLAGHSIGEVAAAHVAGVLSLEDAATLVSARARLMQALPAGGAMVAVQASEVDVLPLLTDGVSIAAVNSPGSVVLAGEEQAVLELAGRFERTTRLRVSHAFHSHLMDPMLAGFRAVVSSLSFAPPRIPLAAGGDVTDPEYWVRHVRETVRFADAVAALREAGASTFLEVGPDGPLSAMAREQLPESATVAPLLRKDRPEEVAALTAAARLHVTGIDVDWTETLAGLGARRIDLPTYPFQHERYWAEPTTPAGVGADPVDAEFWAAVERADLESLASTLDLDGETVTAMVPALSTWRRRRHTESTLDSWRYRESWSPLAEPAPHELTGRWLAVVPDGADEWVTTVAAALGTATVSVGELEGGEYEGVVSLLAPAAREEPQAAAAATANLVRALAETGIEAPLWVVTRGAVAVDDTDPLPRPAQAAVWGLGRVAAMEQPHRWGGLVDLPETLDERMLRRTAGLFAESEGEDQVAVRSAGAYGRRLIPASGDAPAWTPSGTVLVTGGTGALGQRVARWLAANGAERLLLVSRRGPDARGAAELNEELTAIGVDVTIAACDAADRAAVAALLDGRRLSAVVHTAGTLDDGVLDSLTPDRFDGVFRSKVDAALVLDELAPDVDAFVLFSSTAHAIGNPGQANYAAANAALEAIAARRWAAGRAATSIAWGAWAGDGMASRDGVVEWTRSGVAPMDPDLALTALARAAGQPAPAVVVADIRRPHLLEALNATRPSLLLADLPGAAAVISAAREAWATAGTAGAALRERLGGLPEAERTAALLDLVRERAGAVLGYGATASLDVDKAFRDLGFDSLTAVELRNQLGTVTGLALPAALVFDFPTPRALATHLLGELTGESDGAVVARVRTAGETDEPIAIVGMACRFPGGVRSPEDLWRLVDEGRDAISAFPADRGWDPAIQSDTHEGGFLDGVADFDAAFFGISPREAVAMDPQQRLLLETAWEAFEAAGFDPGAFRASQTGVFVGTNGQDYAGLFVNSKESESGHAATGLAASVIAGRLAYTFGLEGPAMTVDTACSSSLLALHLAAESLRRGECDLALAGGVTVMTTSDAFVELSRQGALSPDGRCKAFGEGADGTGFAEGVGLLLVERLADAERNGHRVLALLRGSAVNQDGASNGLSAPNGRAQQRVTRQALANAGLDSSDVDAVEAHGTGTKLGDPIEAQALLAAYGQERERPLWLGSVKSNIGHTQAAAGVASVIKMVEAMRHGVLPKTLHAETPTPHVDWTAGAVQPLTERIDWPETGRPRRVGVSSFGISGTNVHAILEQAPARPESPLAAGLEPAITPYMLSGKTPVALRGQAAALADHLDSHRDMRPAEVAYALATTRAAFDHRAVVLGAEADQLRERLRALANGEQPGGVATGVARTTGKVAFVFPGQGSQWAGMAVALLDTAPAFAEHVARCERALAPHLDWKVTDVLRAAPGAPSIDQVGVVQPVLFTVMVSLAALWQSYGVRPDAVVGTSQGEIAAAYVAGALSLEDAALVIARRSRVLGAELVDKGALASLALPVEAAQERISRWNGRLSIGGINAPALVTVAGDHEALAELGAECEAEGIRMRVVAASVSTHCADVDPIRPQLLDVLTGLSPRDPDVPIFSTVTGERLAPGELVDAEYWYSNTREPVLFGQATERLLAYGCDTFLEISPHPVLSLAIDGTAAAAGAEPAVLGSLRRGEGGLERFLTSLGEAHARGVPVDWTAVLPATRPVSLPTYAFQRDRYWPVPSLVAGGGSGDPLDKEFWGAVESEDVDGLAARLDLPADSLADVVPALLSWRRQRRDESTVESWRYRVAWRPIPALGPATLTGTWLLATAHGFPAGDVASALEAAGAHVRHLVLDESCVDRAALATQLGDVGPVAGIVSVAAAAEEPCEAYPGLAVGLALNLALLQALGDAGIDAPLWLLTRGAVAAGPADRVPNPVQAQVLGLGWSAALEHPHRWGGVVDVPEILDATGGRRLAAVLAGAGEDQVALRASGALARRVVRAPSTPNSSRPWAPRGTILVTGGTGTIGPDLVRWLAGQGAEHIVLPTRRGLDAPGMADLATELGATGTRVDVIACEVAHRDAVAALLAGLKADGHTIRTAIHAAAVIELAMLAETSMADFERVIAAKVRGAQHLDELLDSEELDAFVLYSSNAGMWGSGEHGAYVAGNAYLGALAHSRRARGLVATSVHWGKWPDDVERFGQEDPFGIRRGGLEYIDPQLALSGLKRTLDDDETAIALTNVRWDRYFPVFTSGRATTLFDEVPEVRALSEADERATDERDEGEFAARLRGLLPAEQERMLLALVRGEAAKVLGHASPEALGDRRAFREVGFDSVTAVDLRNRLATATGLTLPATMVFDHPNPVALADFLRGQVLGTAGAAATPVAAAHVADDEPIAIVGMACRYPGGVRSPEDLWRLVLDGVDAITSWPTDRGWDAAALYDADRDREGKTYSLHGGFLDDAAGFDPGFFGVSPREALAMDPQQRLLLETAWEAVERAGIDPASLRGSQTGAFIGATYQDYAAGASTEEASETHMVTGSASCVVSGRVSYLLGLEGPAVSLDTGCSSSLVALHLAAQSLRTGESSLALAGGVTVMPNPTEFVAFSRLGALSTDGRCKAFGEGADGMSLAEGVGVVLVEKLSDAVRNGHPVLAVLRGSAMNQDGASNGLTAPNGPSQQRVIRQALANAGLAPSDVDAVEAHGTGTALGDPIEAQALLATYGQDRDRPLLLGSVKSNIGHTQMASGVAGIIKMVMALRHGHLPRTLHADERSSHVDWTAGAIELLTDPTEWPVNGHPRRAGVSSFGISGTNVHAILEEAPASGPPIEADGPAGPVPWLVSGRSGDALREQAAQLLSYLEAGADPAHLGWSLATARSTFEHRAVIVGESLDDARAGLSALVSGAESAGLVTGAVVEGGGRGGVFVFPGQGSQWWGMGRELMASSDVFREAVHECAAALAPYVDWSVADVVAGTGDPELMERVDVVQPALFTIMVALAELWRSYGVTPAAVVGHSQGEIAAAYVAGALSLADAAAVVALRSRALVGLCGHGGMMSVAAPVERVTELVTPWAGDLSVAAVNGPASVVVSGTPAALDALAAACEQVEVRARRVSVDYASHGPQVESVRDELLRVLAGVRPQPSRIPFYSTVSGGQIDTSALDAEYWYTNLRQTVRMDEATQALMTDGHRVFIEASPHPVLVPGLPDDVAGVGSLRRDDGGRTRFLTSLAEAHVLGVPVDWRVAFPGAGYRVLDLPTYPFQRRRFWISGEVASGAAGETAVDAEFWELVAGGDLESLASALEVDADAVREVAPALSSWRDRGRARSTVDSWRYRVEWTRLPDPPVANGHHTGPWLVVVPPEADPWVEEVVAALGPDTVRAEAAKLPTGETFAGVVALLGATDEAGTDGVPAGLAATVALLQALGASGITAPLWCVTRGAVSTGPQDPVTRPLQAAVWGLGRVAALEHPDRWGGLVDLPERSDSRIAARLLGVLRGDSGEDQVAVRASGVHGRRLRRASARPATVARPWRSGGTVLVTGGTGGVGGQVALWAARSGAAHLLLTSRRGLAAPGAAQLVSELESLGARVTVASCDVSDRDAVAALLAGIPSDAPLTAVMHAAGAVDGEGPVAALSGDQLGLMFGSKGASAWHLHQLTAHLGLSDFVLFSSGAGVWGSGGQPAYAAANAYLDALAEYRRSEGLAATSVAWGAWGEAGLAARSEVNEQLRRRGVLPMEPPLALAALQGALEDGTAVLTVTNMDWERFAPTFTASRPSPLLSDLAEVRRLDAAGHEGERNDGDEPALKRRLDTIPASERGREVLELVRAAAGAVLGYEAGEPIPAGRAFRDLGFDSVSAVELRNRLKAATGLTLPGALAFDYPTPTALAQNLLARLYPEDVSTVAADDPDAEIRRVLASIPVSRLRKAGLLDMVLQLAKEDGEVPAPAPTTGTSIDDMDAESLLQLAIDNTTT